MGLLRTATKPRQRERDVRSSLPSCEGVARARAPCYEVQMYSNPGLTPCGLDKLDG
jgi:hypothetical protein